MKELDHIFRNITKSIKLAISQVGDNPNDYKFTSFPFTIERYDGNPVSQNIIDIIEKFNNSIAPYHED